MSEDALAEVLKDDGLNMDEAEIIKYVKEWAAVNSVSKTDCKLGETLNIYKLRHFKQMEFILFYTPLEMM